MKKKWIWMISLFAAVFAIAAAFAAIGMLRHKTYSSKNIIAE